MIYIYMLRTENKYIIYMDTLISIAQLFIVKIFLSIGN